MLHGVLIKGLSRLEIWQLTLKGHLKSTVVYKIKTLVLCIACEPAEYPQF